MCAGPLDPAACGRKSARSAGDGGPKEVKSKRPAREKRVLIDHRTYTVRPGTMPAQVDLYSKLAYPVQLRYMGEPLYYLLAESGELNTMVHGWVYESAGDREAKRKAMQADPDWKVYLSENAKAGNIMQQRNVLMVPAPFAPQPVMPKIVR
jgi:hypothetical protein